MVKSSWLWTVVVVLGLLPGGAWAQQSGAVTPLTDQDRAEIRELVARYARALSGCQDTEYASLFTPDGTFTSDDFRGKTHREMYGANGGTLKGRTQIAELVRTEEFCMDGKPRTNAGGTNRPVPAVDIKAAPGGAIGSAPIGQGGRYDDVYVKTAEGWRFKSRKVTMPPLAGAAASSTSQSGGGSFTTSDGVRLHYSDTVRGSRTMVFIPGWTMSGEIWEPQIKAFSSKYRVITLDPRAQGASEMTGDGLYLGRRGKDIGELLEHLNLSDVILAGWSMGVREVITYAATGTSRIGALGFVEGNLWPQGTLEGQLQSIRNMQADRKGFTRNFVKTMYLQPQSEAYFDKVYEMSMKTPTDAAAVLMLANAFGPDTDMRPLFSKLDKPVLMVGPPSKKPQGEALKAKLPSARIEYLEGAGHALFVDQAEKFNAILEDFVQRLPSKK
jgi:microsomal epoxide hydrolase